MKVQSQLGAVPMTEADAARHFAISAQVSCCVAAFLLSAEVADMGRRLALKDDPLELNQAMTDVTPR